jgi:hypothetical protein
MLSTSIRCHMRLMSHPAATPAGAYETATTVPASMVVVLVSHSCSVSMVCQAPAFNVPMRPMSHPAATSASASAYNSTMAVPADLTQPLSTPARVSCEYQIPCMTGAHQPDPCCRCTASFLQAAPRTLQDPDVPQWHRLPPRFLLLRTHSRRTAQP